mgnify:CR=1 FL=1
MNLHHYKFAGFCRNSFTVKRASGDGSCLLADSVFKQGTNID